MSDQLNFGKRSVYKEGYGIVAKLVMRDKDLSPEAKAIYAYICSFAGSGTTAFPSAELMMHELKMGDKRFYKFRKELTDKGYISILKQRNGNRREKNIYQIVAEPIEHSRFESVQNESFQNESFQNEGSNSNSITINSSINNNTICSSKELPNKDVYTLYEQSGFGFLNATLIELIDADVEIYTKKWVLDAMKEAVRQNRYKFGYVEGILRNWKADGRTSKEEKKSGVNGKPDRKNYTSGPSKETLRLEEIARENGLIKDGDIQDTECDF
ncbi:helix-turn-helix domain-containing protein [Clostridium sp. JN-9]|uniref:helix-turn-helix domain-containing protein n=1 Tax=Clostridium sp. JN-9 TaxID=2507159 RepID=UPI000FFE0F3E|nr:helix-turn-helix domain-containing protein [Clostridium sp. JN-9]QAT40862.1 DnaD domain protein [Clostridium sp. JN-9]